MGAKLPLLLHPSCPPGDDGAIAGFLDLVASAASTEWAELFLTPNDGGKGRTYLHGTVDGDGFSTVIDAGKVFTAKLRHGGTSDLDEKAVRLLSATLTSILKCHRLKTQTGILIAALDSTSSSILVFDRRGEILYANPPADRLLSLQTEDEMVVVAENRPGRPLFAVLSELVDRCASSPTEAPSWRGTLEAADGRVISCEVTRLPSLENFSDTVLVILQQFGSESAARVDGFCASHGLSPREQEVVLLAVEGLTTVAIADRLGISPHTVRDHFKNLYRKTGASSRSELLGLVSRAAPADVGDRA